MLVDILCLAIFAVIAEEEDWEDIEECGKLKYEWLKKHLKLPNKIPSHDTISRVFPIINPHVFQEAFLGWINTLDKQLRLRLVAIDGKTLRRSYDRRSMKSA